LFGHPGGVSLLWNLYKRTDMELWNYTKLRYSR